MAWQTVGAFDVLRVDSGAPWHANCYLVRHSASGEQVVIDPGGNGDEIARQLGARAPTHILLTHAHHDHVAAAGQLCGAFGLPCRVHPADVRLLRHAPMYAMRFGGYRMESPTNVLPLDEGPLTFAGSVIRASPLPGHTAGGVAYGLQGMVFTGDVLLKSAVGRTDLPGGNAATLRESVTSLLAVLSPDTVIYPGHGKPWTAGEAAAWWSTVADAAPEHRVFGH